MKQSLKSILLLFSLITFIGCVTPVKKPTTNNINNKSGAVTLKIGFPIYFPLVPDRLASKVFLMKLSKDKKNYAELPVVESTFESRDQVTFLNLEPGDYVIAGFYRLDQQSNHSADLFVILDDESITKSTFRVKENEMNILGTIYCMIAKDGLNLQGNQLELSKKIAPGVENNRADVLLTAVIGGHTKQVRIETITKIKNSPEEIDSFKPVLSESFEGTIWKSHFKNLN